MLLIDLATAKEIYELKYEIWKVQDKINFYWFTAISPIIIALGGYWFTIYLTNKNNRSADERLNKQFNEDKEKKNSFLISTIGAMIELMDKQAYQISLIHCDYAKAVRYVQFGISTEFWEHEMVYQRNKLEERNWEFQNSLSKFKGTILEFELLSAPLPDCFRDNYTKFLTCRIYADFNFATITPLNIETEYVKQKSEISNIHLTKSFAFYGGKLLDCIYQERGKNKPVPAYDNSGGK